MTQLIECLLKTRQDWHSNILIRFIAVGQKRKYQGWGSLSASYSQASLHLTNTIPLSVLLGRLPHPSDRRHRTPPLSWLPRPRLRRHRPRLGLVAAVQSLGVRVEDQLVELLQVDGEAVPVLCPEVGSLLEGVGGNIPFGYSLDEVAMLGEVVGCTAHDNAVHGGLPEHVGGRLTHHQAHEVLHAVHTLLSHFVAADLAEAHHGVVLHAFEHRPMGVFQVVSPEDLLGKAVLPYLLEQQFAFDVVEVALELARQGLIPPYEVDALEALAHPHPEQIAVLGEAGLVPAVAVGEEHAADAEGAIEVVSREEDRPDPLVLPLHAEDEVEKELQHLVDPLLPQSALSAKPVGHSSAQPPSHQGVVIITLPELLTELLLDGAGCSLPHQFYSAAHPAQQLQPVGLPVPVRVAVGPTAPTSEVISRTGRVSPAALAIERFALVVALVAVAHVAIGEVLVFVVRVGQVDSAGDGLHRVFFYSLRRQQQADLGKTDLVDPKTAPLPLEGLHPLPQVIQKPLKVVRPPEHDLEALGGQGGVAESVTLEQDLFEELAEMLHCARAGQALQTKIGREGLPPHSEVQPPQQSLESYAAEGVEQVVLGLGRGQEGLCEFGLEVDQPEHLRMGDCQALVGAGEAAQLGQQTHKVDEFGVGAADLPGLGHQRMLEGPLQSQLVEPIEQSPLVLVVEQPHDALDGGAGPHPASLRDRGPLLALPDQGHAGVEGHWVHTPVARLTASSLHGGEDRLEGVWVEGEVDGVEGLLQLLLDHKSLSIQFIWVGVHQSALYAIFSRPQVACYLARCVSFIE